MTAPAEHVRTIVAGQGTAAGKDYAIATLKLLLVLAPMVATIWGLHQHRILEGLPNSHYWMLGRLLLLCMLSQGVAWLVWRRLGPVALLVGSALFWLAQLAYFAGFAAVACTVALVLAAHAAGSCLVRGQGADVLDRFLPGMAVLVALVAWTLPFPIHDPRLYIGFLTALILLRWRILAADGARVSSRLAAIARSNPWLLLLLVTLTGFASMGLWLPSLNYDDNSVHLALQTQLLQDGYYRFDIASQVWAMSPWFNNVWHAIGAMMLGAESRAAGNLVWLLLGAAGAWRLATALGASSAARPLAAALYVSHPLTVYFGTTLQVDGPSTALLLHLAALLVAPDQLRGVRAWTLGALIGMLLSLKVTNVVYLLVPCLYVTLVALRGRGLGWWCAVIGAAVVTGGSSYVYALLLTGSPVFPLFNTVFQSPYYPPVGFSDPRWHVGVSPSLPWDLTFATQKYMEAEPGAIGLSLMALSGAAALGLASGWRTALLTLFTLLPAAVLFHEVQYVRYIFPCLAGLGVVAVVAMDRLPSAFRLWWQLPVVLLCLINMMLMSTTSWIMRSGAWEGLVASGPAYATELRRQAIGPQLLLERMKARQPMACALNTDAAQPFTARFMGSALSTAWYDPQSQRAVAWAREDATGERWVRLLAALGVSHVVQVKGSDPALDEALVELGSVLQDQEGGLELWGVHPGVGQCQGAFFSSRDTARRLLHHDAQQP